MEDELSIREANRLVEESLAVNLDEVSAEPILVAVRELIEYTDEHGQLRRRWQVRHAELETFVPMRIFNRMVATRQKAIKERERFEKHGGEVGTEEDPMVGWMVRQVLAVWQLTEPDMTYEALMDGLDFQKVNKLFTVFFADLMNKGRKAGQE